jgi:putative tryptophan/tyrosine transport system substrate-binding protein
MNDDETIRQIWLFTYAAAEPFHTDMMDVAEAALARLGWVHGPSFRIHRAFGGRDRQHTADLAAAILAERPDVVLSFMTNATLALFEAGAVCPVVSWSMDMAGGLGGGASSPPNLTGVSFPSTFQRDQLQLLRKLKPDLSRVGHLHNPGYAIAGPALERMTAAAEQLDIDLRAYICTSADELAATIERSALDGSQAITVGPHEMFNANGATISKAALAHGLPAIGLESVAAADGVAGFAPDFPAIWQRGAEHAAKLLSGTPPEAIPVDLSIPPRLLLNLRTCRLLGLAVPEDVRAQADRIVA